MFRTKGLRSPTAKRRNTLPRRIAFVAKNVGYVTVMRGIQELRLRKQEARTKKISRVPARSRNWPYVKLNLAIEDVTRIRGDLGILIALNRILHQEKPSTNLKHLIERQRGFIRAERLKLKKAMERRDDVLAEIMGLTTFWKRDKAPK